jgi:hypothetical protein
MPLVASEAGSNCRRGAISLPGQGNGGHGRFRLEHLDGPAREDRGVDGGFVKPHLDVVPSPRRPSILSCSEKL